MAQGLIAAALGGFGKALSTIGEMEAKKQNEAKLRKELMDMESEERLRLDEVMFQREQDRAIPKAQTAAKASVAGRSTTIDEENRVDLPAREVTQSVAKDKKKLEQELKQDIPKLRAELASRETKAKIDEDIRLGVPGAQAGLKVLQRIEELKAIDFNKLPEAEAKAKYSALLADIEEAKRTKYWDSYFEAEANKLVSSIEAQITAGVPEVKAKLNAIERKRTAEALVDFEVSKSEAKAAVQGRADTARALLDSDVFELEGKVSAVQNREKDIAFVSEGAARARADAEATERLEKIRATYDNKIPQEEAKLFAMQELAKVKEMIAQGVPEAKARLLAAEWRASKTQRDEAAAEKTQNEINDAITKAGNKGYVKAERVLAANTRFPSGDSGSGVEKVSTADLQRKLEAAQDALAAALGVSDKNKINEKIESLKKKAATDPIARQKLEDIEQLRKNVERRRNDLQSWRDKPEEDKGKGKDKGSATSYKVGEERILSDGPNKGKIVVWDGKQWNLKK